MRRAVFLDRDGVLNRAVVREGKPYPPATLAELEILPGVARGARARSRARGFLLIVVTNQPDVARGTQSRETVEEMHAVLSRSFCRSTSSASAITTTPTAATAASPSRACCSSGRRVRHRSAEELHGRRPLARRRGRARRRVAGPS